MADLWAIPDHSVEEWMDLLRGDDAPPTPDEADLLEIMGFRPDGPPVIPADEQAWLDSVADIAVDPETMPGGAAHRAEWIASQARTLAVVLDPDSPLAPTAVEALFGPGGELAGMDIRTFDGAAEALYESEFGGLR